MREMVQLGLRLLIHDKRRLFAMSASISVGVGIMFSQLGLLEGVLDAQAIVARFVRGDLLVMNQARVDLQHWDTINRYELPQIAAAPGVAKVTPVYEDHVGLTDPDDKHIRRIIVYAFFAALGAVALLLVGGRRFFRRAQSREGECVSSRE